jgi:hypothetical protein
VLQCRPTRVQTTPSLPTTWAALSPRSPRAATPPRHLPADLHASAMQHRPHVHRTPSSPALIHCEPHTEGLPFSLHPFRAASSICSLRTRAQLPSTEPYRCATPSSCAMSTSSIFQPRATPLSSEQRHQRGATGVAPLRPRASTGPPPATPAPPRAPPERRTPSRPNTRLPTTAGHPLHADPLRPTAHRHRATAMVSLPPPFASNRSHHRPGPLPG